MVRGSRQFHSKSRRGCGQCKKRHVRCNLEAPICFNCRRRGEACDYLDSLFGLESSAWSTADQSMSLGLDSVVSDLPMATITWFLSTIPVFPRLSPAETAWLSGMLQRQVRVSPFLKLSIVSVCEMHEWVDSGGSSDALYVAAHQHNIDASARFRLTQLAVSDRNWPAALAFGLNNIIFQFAQSQRAQGVFDYITVFRVLRGTLSLTAHLRPFLFGDPLHELLALRLRLPPADLDQAAAEALQRLQGLDNVSIHCARAVASLAGWARAVNGHPRSWLHFIGWPIAVTAEYLDMLENGDSLALVIFAYWAAFMHRAPPRWFSSGWARRAAVDAMSKVDQPWRGHLDWPMAVVHSTPVGEDSSSVVSAD